MSNLTYKILLVFSLILVAENSFSQNKFFNSFLNGLSFSASLNYVSSASIQPYPYSRDIIERNFTDYTKGGYGFSFSIKKNIYKSDLFINLSAEYIRIYDNELSQLLESDTGFIYGRVTENIKAFPVELSLYFKLPQFTDNFSIYLGGGAGIYFGDRQRTLRGIESITLSKAPKVNILVLSGMEYRIDKNISLFMEARFRKAQFNVSSKFPVNYTVFNGTTFFFDPDMNSKIFVDGVRISLGLSYYFTP